MTKKILTALCTLSFLFAPASFAKRTVDFTKWTTPEGLLVYYVSAPEIPMVDITLAFAAGSARDGERPGIANLTNELLLGGAGKLDANQLAIAFDEVGATVQNEVGREMATMHLRTLSDKNSFE
ncbi:MAG: insulinase family protein, partial [Bacillota bacterium]|nr:insulinase family protein [Bacillota bacterium]